MKSFLVGLIDDISLEAIEKFANVLMIKYETALKQEQVGDSTSDVGIGFEISIKILERELERARKELKDDM